MKSLSIDAETMGNLTEDEIKLLTVLGIPLKEKKKTEKALVHIPKEYDLVVTKVCRLCGHSEAKLYHMTCLLYTSPSPRDRTRTRMPSSA